MANITNVLSGDTGSIDLGSVPTDLAAGGANAALAFAWGVTVSRPLFETTAFQNDGWKTFVPGPATLDGQASGNLNDTIKHDISWATSTAAKNMVLTLSTDRTIEFAGWLKDVGFGVDRNGVNTWDASIKATGTIEFT